MNTSAIISSIVSILQANSTLSSMSREITSEYKEVPYLKGSYVLIYVTSGTPSFHPNQPMTVRRYELPIIINLEQRKAKMSDSETELNTIVDTILSVVEDNRKKITGVNTVSDITITKDFDSEDVETRYTSIELTLDIFEE